MAFRLLARTRENTSTTGTGPIALDGAAAANNRTFASQLSEGDQTVACVISADGTVWEEGLYTLTSGALARTQILANHLGTTAAVNISGGRVFGCIPHDPLFLLAKALAPANDQVIKYDAGLGRFVTSFVGGVNWHKAVALATAAALPANTYNNGTAGVGATLTGNSNGALSVDSVATVVGYRILVKDEGAPGHNGIYVVTAAGDGTHPYVLTRAADHDDAGDIAQADTTVVGVAGDVNGRTIWVSTIAFPFTVGSSSMTWSVVVGLPPIGSDGDVLTVVGGVAEWAPPTGGGGAPSVLTARGDWDPANAYSANDVARDGADFYAAIVDIPASSATAPDISDVSGIGFASGLQTSEVVHVTTTVPNTFVVLFFVTGGGSISTITSGSLLDFSLHARHVRGDGGAIEIWTAWSPGVLTSEAITVTFAGATSYGFYVVPLKDVNAFTAFDYNPASELYNAAGSLISGFSTSNAADLIFYISHSKQTTGYNNALYPSGFTTLGTYTYIPAQSNLAYKRVTSPQSSITIPDPANGADHAWALAISAGNARPAADTTRWVRLSGFDTVAFDAAIGATRGDIPFRGATSWGRRAAGAANTILAMGAADPAWATLSAVIDAAIGGTRGNILARGASLWSVLGPGAVGTVLTMGAADPAWAAPAGGGGAGALTLVSTQSGSAADYHWTGLSGFDAYRLCGRIIPATSNVDLRLTFGTGAGPTYLSSGYFYAIPIAGSGGFTTTQANESQANIPFATGVANTVGLVFDWLVETDNATFVMISGTHMVRSNDGHTYSMRIGAGVALAAPLTAIKIVASSGNTTGKVSLYSLTE